MAETVIGSIMLGVNMHHSTLRVIFTSDKVIIITGDFKKLVAGTHLEDMAAIHAIHSNWKDIKRRASGRQIVAYGNSGITTDILSSDAPPSSFHKVAIPYGKIKEVSLYMLEKSDELTITFRESPLTAQEVITVAYALEDVKKLLEKTPLADRLVKKEHWGGF